MIPPEMTGGMTGFVVGECLHRVAGSEWRAGFRQCEHCGPDLGDDDEDEEFDEDDEVSSD